MKKFCFIGICLMLSVGSYAQSAVQAAVPQQMRAQLTLDRMARGGIGTSSLLYGIPGASGQLIGDYYLDKKWNTGTIMLIESETLIEGYPLKYDIKSQTIEILSKGGVKLLDTKKVKSVVWLDSLTKKPSFFVNAANYKEDGTPLTGLLEVIADGDKPLFSRSTIWVKKSTYVAAFDVGNKDEIINKKQNFYFNEGTELKKISSKKKLLPTFGSHSSEVDSYIKKNDLGVGDRIDLQRIFEFYNSKVTPVQP